LILNSATFGIFGVACFVGYWWSTYVVPETAQMSLEEIEDAVFRTSAAREDTLLRREVSDMGSFPLIVSDCDPHSQIEEELGLGRLIRGLAL
jgi:hypothetical protein